VALDHRCAVVSKMESVVVLGALAAAVDDDAAVIGQDGCVLRGRNLKEGGRRVLSRG
jgi:hypothetical protein